MKRQMKGLAIIITLLLGSHPSWAQVESHAVLVALRQELSRSMRELSKLPQPPYYLAYEVDEVRGVTITSSFGTITSSAESHVRELDVDIRVGDYNLDNTHPIRGNSSRFDFGDRTGPVALPTDNDANAMRSVIWYDTDKKYKRAVERLRQVKTNSQVAVEREDTSPDFSREKPEKDIQPVIPFSFDRAVWEGRLRKYTAPFRQYGNLYEATAYLNAFVNTEWTVNSDGTEIQTSHQLYRLVIAAISKADDGMELPRYESFMAFSAETMPDDATVLKAADRMIQDLQRLRTAPVAEPYTGPAVLSGRASAVFFHEVFGHRIEGHRQKDEAEGQTFKKKVNEQVLPPTMSVVSDPTTRRMANTDLAGFYRYDDEGVKARRVVVVENGVLKNFLMSRSPVEGFVNSNGHGRRQVGLPPVARQSNLIVSESKPVSRAQLKQMLLDEVKRQNKPYGLLFDDIEGGFTITLRVIPNAFNVLPTMVYRVYPDGREELVRGVDLIGTPLMAFSKILAADEEVAVFNGVCGAESGWVPVSAVSPGILVSQIEVQRKEKSQERPPILPPPFTPEK